MLVAGWLGGPRSPNADGLVWFVREVLPLVVARIPWFRLRVTGANPPPAIASLGDQSVTLVGGVEDLAPVYNAARLAISPLRFGSGVKMKVLEAISLGWPLVLSSLKSFVENGQVLRAPWYEDEIAEAGAGAR